MLAAPGAGRSSSRRSRGWRRRRPRHLPQIGTLLDAIGPLRVASESPVDAARAAMHAHSSSSARRRDLGAHAWWRQAEAARALGLVRADGALRPLLGLPRRAPIRKCARPAVEALGHLGDPGCVPALLRGLPDASRHQRARVVESIRELGPGVAHALVAHARAHPDNLATVAELIGFTGAGDRRRQSAGVVEPRQSAGAGGVAAGAGLARARRPRLLLRAARARGHRSDAVRAMGARALGRAGGSTRRRISRSISATNGWSPRTGPPGCGARGVGRGRARRPIGGAGPGRGAGATDAVGTSRASRGGGAGMRAPTRYPSSS